MRRKQTDRKFVLCVKNDDCDDLEKRKVYRVIADEKSQKDGYVRMVDESGEDYLYPASYFVRLQLPQKAEQAIVATGQPEDRNPHHIMEAIFKALAKALDQATMLEERLAGKVLSTKGML